ncbi:MAG: hypothetical protein ACSHXY_15110 [Alphaproteobacteria bacterium]
MRAAAFTALLLLSACKFGAAETPYGVCDVITKADFEQADKSELARFNKKSTANGEVEAVIRGSGTLPEYEGSLDGPSLIQVKENSVIEITYNSNAALYLRAPEKVVFALDFETYTCRVPG